MWAPRISGDSGNTVQHTTHPMTPHDFGYETQGNDMFEFAMHSQPLGSVEHPVFKQTRQAEMSYDQIVKVIADTPSDEPEAVDDIPLALAFLLPSFLETVLRFVQASCFFLAPLYSTAKQIACNLLLHPIIRGPFVAPPLAI